MHNFLKSHFCRFKYILAILLTIISSIYLIYFNFSITRDPSLAKLFRQPSFEVPNQQTTKLIQTQKYLASISDYFPTEVPFRHLSQRKNEELFFYVQALLAPRRIGPDINSQYIHVFFNSENWPTKQTELQNSRLVLSLGKLGSIYQQDNSK